MPKSVSTASDLSPAGYGTGRFFISPAATADADKTVKRIMTDLSMFASGHK
jgi:hypothetical protein